jgi:hypothetical protein
MMRIEHRSYRQAQAAIEAVKVLERAGFNVGEFEIGTEPAEPSFELDVDLSISQMERPLERVPESE